LYIRTAQQNAEVIGYVYCKVFVVPLELGIDNLTAICCLNMSLTD